jgi:hypothetical protein
VAVGEATKLLATDTGREMLAILRAELPSVTSPLPVDAREAEIIRAYGVELGYQACIARLVSLAEPLDKGESEPLFRDEFTG